MPKRIHNYYEVEWGRNYDPPHWKRRPPAPSLRSLPPDAVLAVAAYLKPKHTTVEADQ